MILENLLMFFGGLKTYQADTAVKLKMALYPFVHHPTNFIKWLTPKNETFQDFNISFFVQNN